VHADTVDPAATNADRLRHALVDQLGEQGAVQSAAVESALRAVPRHVFVPGVSAEVAYADDTVPIKRDASGTPISAASQPTIVALMLEQLDVRPGQRVLEIGAATGYNAALLAHLAGDDDRVTTVEVDDDLVEGTRVNLAAAGRGGMRVVHWDGAFGCAAGAPYDRIIATVGAHDLPPAWLEQLAEGGRLVAPLRLRGSVTRSVALERDPHRRGVWRAVDHQMCGFMPLRGGIADDPRRVVPLTADVSVTLHAHQDQTVDPAPLAGVFRQAPARDLDRSALR
jgi:protein-L-isoaspartate(D-aspartate) O-methyltransferase